MVEHSKLMLRPPDGCARNVTRAEAETELGPSARCVPSALRGSRFHGFARPSPGPHGAPREFESLFPRQPAARPRALNSRDRRSAPPSARSGKASCSLVSGEPRGVSGHGAWGPAVAEPPPPRPSYRTEARSVCSAPRPHPVTALPPRPRPGPRPRPAALGGAGTRARASRAKAECYWGETARGHPGPYSKEIIKMGKAPTCTKKFTAAVFVVAKNWKSRGWPSIEEWLN
ncbi:uncharacterized protein [Notamacropus eugenii]|uniref:uncharacterized protein n=1 Tax=Notamacropus eugenii TaxID=9315 RepID=UPI003B680ABC